MGYQPFQQIGDGRVGDPGRPRDEGDLCGGVGRSQFQQPVENQRGSLGVGGGPVGLAVVQPQVFRQRDQVVLGQGGQEYGGQIPGVVAVVAQVKPVRTQEAQVESDVVAHHRKVANEVSELFNNLLKSRCALNLRRAD